MKGNDGKGVTALSIARTLNRRKLYLALPVVLLGPAVYFYSMSLPQKFRARALVGAEALIPGQPGFLGRVDPGTIAAQEQLRAIRATLFSPAVLSAVSHEFQLPYAPPGALTGDGKEDLRSRILIQIDGPDAFYVGFESRDAKQARDVTNRLAQLFVERTSALRGQRVEHQEDVLDNEVARLRGELTAREEALKAYKEKVSQDLPERLGTNLKEMENLQQQIQTKTDQITEAEARKASILEEMEALEKQGVLKVEPPPKTASQVALDELRMKLSQLRTKYTPEHPEIRRTEKEIRTLEAAAATQAAPSPARQPSAAQMRYFGLQAELKPIEPRVASYRQEREALSNQLAELERRISATPAYETTLAERTRDAAMLRARYEVLYAKQQEAKLNQRTENNSESAPTFKVLEAATLPVAPFSPHRERIILFGILASLGLGVAGVFLAERTDTTLETSDEVEEYTSLPVLSAVPAIPTKLSRKAKKATLENMFSGVTAGKLATEERRFYQMHRLTVLSDPQSVASQQYGSLAVRVLQKLGPGEGRTLVVTSASGQEGKSVTALNLSLALAAMLEERVLLIDCDLRLPTAQERLGLKAEKGFRDLLSETGNDFSSYITPVGNLDVIVGGTKAANPLGLLASQRTREVLTELKKRYRIIVLDSPPLVPIADSQILAGLADGTLLVVRARKTRRELFQRVIESLETVNLIGVVLNDVEYAATSYAYAYRDYQRHYLG